MAALPRFDKMCKCVLRLLYSVTVSTSCLKEWRFQGTLQASSKALNEEPTLFSKDSHF